VINTENQVRHRKESGFLEVPYCVRPIEEDNAGRICTVITGNRLERAVSEEVLRILAPVGIEAALSAIDSGQDRHHDQRRQAELALEAARYEAGLARRQYDAVDPGNRLVAAELERRWNERLVTVQRLEAQLAAMIDDTTRRLSTAERDALMRLGKDLPCAWNDPSSSVEIKKRIIRTVVREIVVETSERLVGTGPVAAGDRGRGSSPVRRHRPRRSPRAAASRPGQSPMGIR
jgi:hypothetical protein